MRTLGCGGFPEIFFLFLSETVFAHSFPVSDENEYERRTLVAGALKETVPRVDGVVSVIAN
jgi:hypothetical protein